MQEHINQQVEVYQNLNKGLWSIRAKIDGKWKVVGHVDHLTLQPTKFTVRKSGRERVLREKQKNVHAWIRGYLVDYGQIRNYDGTTEFHYDPYDCDYFHHKSDHSEVTASTYEYLHFVSSTKSIHGDGK